MSYILDALKKSEKERRRGEQPDVFTPQIEPPSLPFSRTNWKAIGLSILVSLVLFAGMVGYFVSSKINEPPQKPPKTTAQPPVSEPLPSQLQPSTTPPPPQTVDTQEATVTRIPLSLSREKHKKKLTPQSENTTQVNIVVKPIDIQSGSLAIEPYTELPETIRRELPALKFAGHTYSQVPPSRLIIINNQILREGGRISPDLRLIEITRTGVVLDFRGKRFVMELENHY